MRFPSIRNVATELRGINILVEGECDVRLQVYQNGDWNVLYGDSSYDQDHRGFWGCSCVPGNGKRFHSMDTARELLEQAKDAHACSGY